MTKNLPSAMAYLFAASTWPLIPPIASTFQMHSRPGAGLLSSVAPMHSRIREVLWMIPTPTLALRPDGMTIVNVNMAWIDTFGPVKGRLDDLVATRLDKLGFWLGDDDWLRVHDFDPDEALKLAISIENLPEGERLREAGLCFFRSGSTAQHRRKYRACPQR